MSGHTPGPWIISRGMGVQIALDTGTPNEPSARFVAAVHDIPEREANARLIAAAPELLAALKHLLNASVGMHGSEAELRAIEAIHKAEGGAR